MIINILKYLIRIFSLIFSYEKYGSMKKYLNIIYSYWLKNSIRECGGNFYISGPAVFKGGQYMSFGNDFRCGSTARIECWDNYLGKKFFPQLIVGDRVYINNNIHIGCINKVIIGDNVLFGSNVFISDHQHGFVDGRDIDVPPANRFLFSKGPVMIEKNVWIGENVSIMPDITIGENSIIGANSIVTKNIAKNSVVAGNPAKLIRTLIKD